MLSRQYYEPVEFYRRGETGVRMPLAHNSGLLDQFETTSQMSRRTTPSSESDRHGATPRKRVPVACERCRKRKIKCSGDEDGGGCSNCRNAGLAGCQFLRVCSTNLMDPSSYLALHQLRAQRSQASHHYSHAHTHYGSTALQSSSHYHPYARHASIRHHNHGHHTQYSPSNSESAYSSHPSTPYPSAMPAEYASYGGAVNHGISWTRNGSYSAYGGYGQDDVPASQYVSHQPASFLLPGGDPMTNNGGAYGMSSYSGSRNNSHANVWGESMQATSSIMGAGYGANLPEASAYDTAVVGSGTAPKEAMVPYHINTSSLSTTPNGDRTLPTPGSRHYSVSMGGTSTLDALPLSALSHRSSIGWSTDSTSSASHISSQTSVTGSSAGHDYSDERSNSHRPSDTQEMGFASLSYGYSPQVSVPTKTLTGAVGEMGSTGRDAYRLSKNTSQSTNIGDSSTMQELPLHTQRCRTVSQTSTPNQLSSMSTQPPIHCHSHNSLASSTPNSNTNSYNNSIGDVPDSGTSSAAPQTASAMDSAVSAAISMPTSAALYGYTAAPSVTPRGAGGAQPQTRGHGLAAASGDGRLSNGYTYTRASASSGVKEYVGVGAGSANRGAEEYGQVADVGVGAAAAATAAAGSSSGRASVASISTLAGY